MMDPQAMVEEFHRKFDIPVTFTNPAGPPLNEQSGRPLPSAVARKK